MYLADTTFLDALEKETRQRRLGPARMKLAALGRARVLISVVSVGEFLRSRDRLKALAFLAPFPIQPVTYRTAERWAAVQDGASGPFGQNDAWIAATALNLGIPIISRDRAFNRMRGLKQESY